MTLLTNGNGNVGTKRLNVLNGIVPGVGDIPVKDEVRAVFRVLKETVGENYINDINGILSFYIFLRRDMRRVEDIGVSKEIFKVQAWIVFGHILRDGQGSLIIQDAKIRFDRMADIIQDNSGFRVSETGLIIDIHVGKRIDSRLQTGRTINKKTAPIYVRDNVSRGNVRGGNVSILVQDLRVDVV